MPDHIFETMLAKRLQLRAAEIAAETPADGEGGNGKIGAATSRSGSASWPMSFAGSGFPVVPKPGGSDH